MDDLGIVCAYKRDGYICCCAYRRTRGIERHGQWCQTACRKGVAGLSYCGVALITGEEASATLNFVKPETV